MIAGFALVEVKSLDEAIEWAPRFARLVGDVEIDVRLVELGGATTMCNGRRNTQRGISVLRSTTSLPRRWCFAVTRGPAYNVSD